MGTLLLVNIVAVTLLYPTLKVTTFDPRFAMALGIRTGAVNAAFMFLVSVTVTSAFHAAGAILVIALMVAPPATAHLLTRRLAPMIVLTIALAAGGALAGFRIAYRFDAATSAGWRCSTGAVRRCLRHAPWSGSAGPRRRTLRGPRCPEREPGSAQGRDPDGVGGGRPQREHLGPPADQHAEGSGER